MRSTDMQRAILCTLARLPYLGAQDLAEELHLGKNAIYDALGTLQGSGCIEKMRTVFCLTTKGMKAVREQEPSLSPFAGMQPRQLLRLRPRLDRLRRLHTIISALAQEAPQLLSEQGKPAHVSWSWIRDYQQSLSALPGFPRRTRLFADALVVLRTREQIYPVFVLLDHACLPQAQIRSRITALLHARNRAASSNPALLSCFPLVLVILEARYRARHWQRWTAQVCAKEQVSLRGCLAVVGPPSRTVLLSMLSWQKLSDYGPAPHLSHGLLPYPASAIPPEWLRPSHHGLFSQSRTPHFVVRFARGHDLLTARHSSILELLFLHPFLSRAQIAAFLDIQESTVEKALTTLHQCSCVEAEQLTKGEDVARMLLTEAGLRHLALRHHLSLRQLALRQKRNHRTILMQRGLDHLRQYAERTIRVSDFFAQIAREKAHPDHRLLWWETGSAPEQSYYSFSRASWKQFQADAIAEYQAGTRRLRFWLVFVGSTYSEQSIVSHLSNLAAFVHSGEWRREGQVLPVLLLVCPDGAREQQIQELVRQMLVKRVFVLTTSLERLEKAGPLAPIWQSVDQQGPRCRFYELQGSQYEYV